jgi:WD40 repeat protein
MLVLRPPRNDGRGPYTPARMSSPTANWEKVGDKFYRKTQLYTALFDQDLELENYIVAGCSYAGAIAIYRDETKLHSFRGSQASKLSIDLYNCAGKLIRRINWDKGAIRGLGWSEDEQLVVVTADGTVRCYYDLQGDFNQFSLGNGAEEYGVTSCRFVIQQMGPPGSAAASDRLLGSTVPDLWPCFQIIN